MFSMLWSGIRICPQVSLILPFTPHTALASRALDVSLAILNTLNLAV
jgi:hypothetical protein